MLQQQNVEIRQNCATSKLLIFISRAKQGDERSIITNGSGPLSPLTDFTPAEPGFSSLQSSLNASGHSSIASAMDKLAKENQQVVTLLFLQK